MTVLDYSHVGFTIRHVRMLAFVMRFYNCSDYKSLYSQLSDCKSERTIELLMLTLYFIQPIYNITQFAKIFLNRHVFFIAEFYVSLCL